MSRVILGLEPRPVPPFVFALDGERLRYASFEHQDGSYRLDRYEVTDLEPGVFGSGPLGGSIQLPDSFGDAMSSLVERVGSTPTEASLILPDSWLRLAIVDTEELPRSAAARDDALKWQLQRIVPFKVDEVRVRGRELTASRRDEKKGRTLLGFALELLLTQLETAFADKNIRLGLLTNESLSLAAAAEDALRGAEVGLVLGVSNLGYSMIVLHRGQPVLHRCKRFGGREDSSTLHEHIMRDLRLTRGFLSEMMAGTRLARVLFVSSDELAGPWARSMEAVFDLPAHRLSQEHLNLTLPPDSAPLDEIVALFGAARQEVS